MSAQDLVTPRLSPARLTLIRFLCHRAAVASAVVLVLLAVAASAAPLVESWLGVDATEVESAAAPDAGS